MGDEAKCDKCGEKAPVRLTCRALTRYYSVLCGRTFYRCFKCGGRKGAKRALVAHWCWHGQQERYWAANGG